MSGSKVSIFLRVCAQPRENNSPFFGEFLCEERLDDDDDDEVKLD